MAPQFTSAESESFVKENGITQFLDPICPIPASNKQVGWKICENLKTKPESYESRFGSSPSL
jgi:hypothetical protein